MNQLWFTPSVAFSTRVTLSPSSTTRAGPGFANDPPGSLQPWSPSPYRVNVRSAADAPGAAARDAATARTTPATTIHLTERRMRPSPPGARAPRPARPPPPPPRRSPSPGGACDHLRRAHGPPDGMKACEGLSRLIAKVDYQEAGGAGAGDGASRAARAPGRGPLRFPPWGLESFMAGRAGPEAGSGRWGTWTVGPP